jgi:hypothetical protein
MRQYEQEIQRAGMELANATLRELALEDERVFVKQAAIGRLLAEPNPATGKPHSATSASDVVGTDAEYKQHLSFIRQATFTKIVARANYEATLAAARLGADMAAVV